MNTGIFESSEYLERTKIFRRLSASFEKRAEQILVNNKELKAKQVIVYSDALLNAISYKIAESETALHEYKVRNQQILNGARKLMYEILIRLEALVSNQNDVPLSDLTAYQKRIEGVDDVTRFTLIRKLFISIDHIKIAYGENTKWKWTFIELAGRASVINRNFLNLRRVSAGLQPEQPGYKECRIHLKLTLEKLQVAANDYCSKYELAGKQLIDMQYAIRLLNSARQLAHISADRELTNDLKRKLTVWKQKIEFEVKRK